MKPGLQQAIHSAITRILTPLVKILLRYNISYGTFANLAKKAYVEAASRKGVPAGQTQTKSKIAIATGLTRKEVLRILREDIPADTELSDKYNRASRVITGWVRDKTFQDSRGNPAALPYEGEKNSFSVLVKKYSGDITVPTMVEEFLTTGAVGKLKDGRIKLLTNAYVPGEGELEKLNILGRDAGGLIGTIASNLTSPGGNLKYQRKVYYNNLPDSVLEKFRKLAADQSQETLENLDGWLSRQKRRKNSRVRGAGLGIYFFEEKWPDKE